MGLKSYNVMERYTHQFSHLQRTSIRDFPAYQEFQGPPVEKQSPESKPVQGRAFACAKSFSLYHVKKFSVNLAKKKALTVQYSETADREIEVIPKNVCWIPIVVPWTLNG